jgi:hypothetical protein
VNSRHKTAYKGSKNLNNIQENAAKHVIKHIIRYFFVKRHYCPLKNKGDLLKTKISQN